MASSAAEYFSQEKTDIPARTARQSFLIRALFSSDLSSVRFQPRRRLTSKEGLIEWATLDSDIPSDCAKERETMDRIHNYLKSAGHLVYHWYYGHFHQSWNSEIDGILFSMLDIMEFKEIR